MSEDFIDLEEFTAISDELIQDLLGYLNRGIHPEVLKLFVDELAKDLSNFPKSEIDFIVDVAYQRYLTAQRH